eukprot:580155-Ditylum_brightwellii.AAC.1
MQEEYLLILCKEYCLDDIMCNRRGNISQPSSFPSANSPALHEALDNAKHALEQHGSDPKEVALA